MVSDRRREKTGKAPGAVLVKASNSNKYGVARRMGAGKICWLVTYSLLVGAASRVAYGPSNKMCSFKENLSPARSVCCWVLRMFGTACCVARTCVRACVGACRRRAEKGKMR